MVEFGAAVAAALGEAVVAGTVWAATGAYAQAAAGVASVLIGGSTVMSSAAGVLRNDAMDSIPILSYVTDALAFVLETQADAQYAVGAAVWGSAVASEDLHVTMTEYLEERMTGGIASDLQSHMDESQRQSENAHRISGMTISLIMSGAMSYEDAMAWKVENYERMGIIESSVPDIETMIYGAASVASIAGAPVAPILAPTGLGALQVAFDLMISGEEDPEQLGGMIEQFESVPSYSYNPGVYQAWTTGTLSQPGVLNDVLANQLPEPDAVDPASLRDDAIADLADGQGLMIDGNLAYDGLTGEWLPPYGAGAFPDTIDIAVVSVGDPGYYEGFDYQADTGYIVEPESESAPFVESEMPDWMADEVAFILAHPYNGRTWDELVDLWRTDWSADWRPPDNGGFGYLTWEVDEYDEGGSPMSWTLSGIHGDDDTAQFQVVDGVGQLIPTDPTTDSGGDNLGQEG